MYLVKKIQVNKSKVTINFEDGEKLEISKDIFPNFYIYEGKLLTRKEIKEIKEKEEQAWN